MKKIGKFLLAFLMILSFTACSGGTEESKPTEIKWGKSNKLDNIVSYQIESISRSQQITPDVIGTLYTYYKPSNPENVLIDITMYMTNLQKKDLKISSAIVGTFIIDKVDYAASTALVSDDGKSISQGGTLNSEGTSKVHFYAEIGPEKLGKAIEFKLATIDEEAPKEAVMKFKLSDIAKKYETKNLNDTITIDGRGEIVLQAINVTKKLEPANPTGLYTYYKVQNDTNSFVVLTTMVKNTSESNLMASDVAVMKLVDKNSNEYPANIFYEKDDRTNLATASSTTLTPGQSGMVHFVFELSDDNANGEKTFRISYQGKVYMLSV